MGEHRDLNFERICEYFRQFSELLKDVSHLVAFESFVEFSGFEEDPEQKFDISLNNGEVRYPDFVNHRGLTIDNKVYYPGLNNLYNEISKVIRETNPTRIMCYRPTGQGGRKLPTITPWRWDTEGDPEDRAGSGDPYWVISYGGSANLVGDWVHGTRTNDVVAKEALMQRAAEETWGPGVDYRSGTGLPVWISLWGFLVKETVDPTYPGGPVTHSEYEDYITWYLKATRTLVHKPNGERMPIPSGFQHSWVLWNFGNNTWNTGAHQGMTNVYNITEIFADKSFGLGLTEPRWAPEFKEDQIEKKVAQPDSAYGDTVIGECLYDRGDVLTYSKTSGPNWLTVAADGTLSGIPSSSDAGTNQFVITASSPLGSDQANLKIVVEESVPPPTEFSFSPIADAHCKENSPDANAGGNTTLIVREQAGNYGRLAFLKFEISDVADEISSATLRLHSEGLDGLLEAVAVSDTTWEEMAITWSNMPPMGAVIGSATASSGSWFEIDVTSHITSNGTFTIGLETTVGGNNEISSREGANPPVLDIQTGGGTTNATPVMATGIAPVNAGTDVVLQWNGTPGKSYRILYTTNLPNGVWSIYRNNITGTEALNTETAQVDAAQCFYHIEQID
jgi:hypothetical protein